MPTITNFAEAQNALRSFYDNSRTPYTLDAIRALMAFLGDPQNKLQVVHVAGTSGKTSTSYYVTALLKAAGHTVGLSVSPHVETLNERLQINGAPLPEREFCAVLGEFLEVIATAPVKPSYFELMVAMAYWEFARRDLEFVVMEVGLGGLLDGTNVVDRPDKICIITDIGLDHTEILGDTLPKIASQKAGIIHQGNQVFMYEQSKEVMKVVADAAAAHRATLHRLPPTAEIELPGLPLFQQRNLGLAVAAARGALRTTLPAEAIMDAAQMVIPARLERFEAAGKTVIIDGAHNQQKMHMLLESVGQLYPQQSLAVLCAFVQGNSERWQGALNELFPAAEYILFTTFHGEQDLPKSSTESKLLAHYAADQGFKACAVQDDPVVAYADLLRRPETLLLVTGSFYLLNHIRPLVRETL